MGKKAMGQHKEAYKARISGKAAERNHLKNVLKSNGLPAAEAYAKQHGLEAYLANLVKGAK
jgi:hypothetical protein